MNYESMSDFEINKAVAKTIPVIFNDDQSPPYKCKPSSVMVNDIVNEYEFNPCNNPSDAWPIIIENNIGVYAKSDSDYEIGMCNFTGCWCANGINSVDGEFGMTVDAFEFVDENPLRAAMIVFLMMNESV